MGYYTNEIEIINLDYLVTHQNTTKKNPMKINNKLGNNAETIKSTLHFFMCKHFFDEAFVGVSKL